MQQLDPRAVWLFFINFLGKSFALTFFVLTFAVVFLGSLNIVPPEKIEQFGKLFFILFIIALFVFTIALAYLLAKLTYHFYRYDLDENGFRKEKGIVWKKYTTIPYERIQNVDIYRGVIARILGLSDLHIQTAGGGGAATPVLWGYLSAEANLPGLSRETAEQVRNELIRRVSQARTSGL